MKSAPASSSAPSATPGTTAAAPAPQGSSALKIILIVLGVLAMICIIVVGGMVYVGKKVVDRTRAEMAEDRANGTVTTPFGKIQTSKDPIRIAEMMGAEVFPGAKPMPDSSSMVVINGTQMMNANFSTASTEDEVLAFYKEKYPAASIIDTPENKMVMIGDKEKGGIVMTINVENGETIIHMSKIAKAEK